MSNASMTHNLPNRLTIARIGMIFVVLFLANIDDKFNQPTGHIIRVAAFCLAVLAGLTDFLDGYLARKYNLISDFGKLMDPLADKVFVATAFIILVDAKVELTDGRFVSILPGWVVVVVLAREFLVTGLRLLAANKGEVIPSDMYGKVKTVAQMACLGVGGLIWIDVLPLAKFHLLWSITIWVLAAYTVLSGAIYFVRHRYLYLDQT